MFAVRRPSRHVHAADIMFGTIPKKETLDLRYNEMWNDWDGTGETATDEERRHPRGQLVLSWKRLNVTVKRTAEKFFTRSHTTYTQILHNVSGNVQCGSLLGIMGPRYCCISVHHMMMLLSEIGFIGKRIVVRRAHPIGAAHIVSEKYVKTGSGKTTLMATISHRTKGNFDGELLLNGQPVSEEVMIKISGFVPQHDISFDQLTAFEHLSLMAKLKMDRHTTEAALKEHVDCIASTLGMNEFLDTRITFLSGGERKKVALAVQLLNDPPILFCDEITTGLDSYSAAHIVNTLKGVARMGKIVICTIHQPASGIFGKFDEVILLSNGRLAYQGPVSMVNQLFRKFGYECPDMFNEADFVISILNSEDENVKKNVDKMCGLSSDDKQTDINYGLFNSEKQLDYMQHLQTRKPTWSTQFSLILNRSVKCFLRSYKTKLLELGTILFLGVIMSAPFSNLKFDTKAVQNWEGFWLIFVINFVFHFSYSAISMYQVTFSVVHREVHNSVYPLSVYYMSQFMIVVIWIVVKMLFYCVTAFWIVGVDWGTKQLVVFFLVGLASFSYGSMLSSYFDRIENTMIFATIYDFVALPLSGAYMSFSSLPKIIYSLRYLSLFFLGCETVSTLFWEKIKSLPCTDTSNCLDSGKAVLMKYGYMSDELYTDLVILASICVIANILGYFGVLQRMKKQPAY